MADETYPHDEVERKWQRYWEEHEVFRAVDHDERPPLYVLDMFPYPSGSGLHVGHPEGYTATDIVARFRWMQGYNVLHPMGWDAFGLPAEQHARETGVHPAETTRRNIEVFKRQIRRLGLAYDWRREIATTDPDYYRWTQWIFLQLFRHGLAYQDEVTVNWCEALGTVLANEEVIDGRSERGNHPVERVPMRQWMLRITAYADRLLDDLELLDWPDSIKQMQRNWIGRSEGAQVTFRVPAPTGGGDEHELPVFTTRPDTLFGVTYMVLAPEHPLVEEVTTPERRETVRGYVEQARQKTDLERTDLAGEKSGVFTGAFALNPVNDEPVPIWVADYVLLHYGTGAVMAVPAHDQRDWEFARTFDLPIRPVVTRPDGAEPDLSEGAWEDPGQAMNSDGFDGLATATVKRRIVDWLAERGVAERTVNYRLRDWVFSRQRFWGEPIPILHLDDGTTKPVPEEHLPVTLPDVPAYEPAGGGESPLANFEDWVWTTDPETGQRARRETHTMPQWAGSCWYYLRYLDPGNAERLVDPERERYWMPVKLYVGGAEHAVLHLLYARFWHKFLYDIGVVSTPEPFMKLVNQGMILGEDGQKMSKSRGNVINPDEVIERYGADTMRLYEMFMGPLESTKPWSTHDIVGIDRFLDRVWRIGQRPVVDGSGDRAIQRLTHRTIRQVTDDVEAFRLNTAISQLMVLANDLHKRDEVPRESIEAFVRLLHPFAPHITEELWERLGRAPSIVQAPWPDYDPALCEEERVEIAVQVNGKLRARFEAPKGADREELDAQARELEQVQRWIADETIRKVVVVPDKLVNFVVG